MQDISKISGLSSLTSANDNDLIPIVDIDGGYNGRPKTKKITVDDLFKNISQSSSLTLTTEIKTTIDSEDYIFMIDANGEPYKIEASVLASLLTGGNSGGGGSIPPASNTWCTLYLTETSGITATDSSGNGRNATCVNCSLNSAGVILTGNSRISLDSSHGALSVMSIGIDFKTDFSLNQGLWEFRASQDLSSGTFTPALIMNSAGNIGVYGYPSGSGYSSASFKDNNWHKCIAIVSNSNIRVFVDKTKILDVSANPITAFNGFFCIGATRANGNFNGQVKNFRVWNVDIGEASAIQNT